MMIRKIIYQSLSRLPSKAPLYKLSSAVIRDKDQLSQQQIDELLGNEPTVKAQSSDLTIQDEQKELMAEKDKFYGLMPKLNENYPICKDPDEREIEETPNQNLFEMMNLTPESSFDDYTKGLTMFRSELDLYGDQTEKAVIDPETLEFKELLKPDSEYLTKARDKVLVNLSIPGTIQGEDPRNFMQLRPIEEFRHTPLVPIAESTMRRHQQMLKEYHRKQFVFEVSTQSVVNWSLIFGSLAIGGYLIYLVLQKEEERTVAYSRLKYKRVIGESDEVPVFKI